eukprot:m.27273 g.27273  ORF g.27273 m.27273 type:complete len:866 (-) comp15716_c0_seq1:99-2696(-)
MGNARSTLLGNFGDVIESFKCKYIGSVPVVKPTGDAIANNAMLRILAMQQPEIVVNTVVTDSGVFVSDKAGNIVRQTGLEAVTFVQQHHAQLQYVVYFENDANNRMIICHMFRFPGDAVAFPRAVHLAFEVQKTRVDDDNNDDGDEFDSSLNFVDGEPDDAKEAKRKTTMKPKSKQKRSVKEMKREVLEFAEKKKVRVKPDTTDLRRELQCRYMGSMKVSADNEPAAKGAMDEILKDIENEPSTLRIYANAILLAKEHGFENTEVQCDPINECTFALNDEDRRLFCYIIRDKDNGTFTAYVVGVPKAKPNEISLRREIHQCIKEIANKKAQEKEKKKGGAGGDTADSDNTEEVRHTYEAIFRGTVVAPSNVDPKDVVTKAIEVVGYSDREEVNFLQCYTEGIRVYDALTSELMDMIVTPEVIGIQSIGRHFILVRNDQKQREMKVYIFRMIHKERAEQVCASCTHFFEASMKRQAKSPRGSIKTTPLQQDEDNPFAGEGARIAAPGNLFQRQIRRANLKAHKVIGAGQFGQVYLAEMQTEQHGVCQCAVKTLKDVKSAADRQEFVHEAEVMLETNHPNLLGLIGVAVQQRPWLMVLDIMEYGDLRGVLMAAPKKHVTLTTKELLLITKETCAGMKYLEEIGFVHCDLAARNVLVGNDNKFKVADFGMTRRLRQRKFWNGPKAMRVPIKWSAIEILQNREFSIKSDIWAFGVLVWEIFSYGDTPYPGLMNADVHRLLLAGGRMKSPGNCPKVIYEVVKTCWKENKDTRPSFKELLSEFEIHFRNSKHKPPRDIGSAIKETTTEFEKKGSKSPKKGDYVYDADSHKMAQVEQGAKPAKKKQTKNTILDDDMQQKNEAELELEDDVHL